jgi:hypothetical protein
VRSPGRSEASAANAATARSAAPGGAWTSTREAWITREAVVTVVAVSSTRAWKRSTERPTRMRSPSARIRDSTRWSLTKVPLVLPQSTSRAPCGPTSIAACMREA